MYACPHSLDADAVILYHIMLYATMLLWCRRDPVYDQVGTICVEGPVWDPHGFRCCPSNSRSVQLRIAGHDQSKRHS